MFVSLNSQPELQQQQMHPALRASQMQQFQSIERQELLLGLMPPVAVMPGFCPKPVSTYSSAFCITKQRVQTSNLFNFVAYSCPSQRPLQLTFGYCGVRAIFFCHGVRLSPLGTATTVRPIVPAPDNSGTIG
jgi:hypothetical protein